MRRLLTITAAIIALVALLPERSYAQIDAASLARAQREGQGTDIYVPESMLEDARNICTAQPDEPEEE